jgi:hypothetical protein
MGILIDIEIAITLGSIVKRSTLYLFASLDLNQC